MFIFRRERSQSQVDFCERCGSVCDSVCRGEALRDETLTRAPLAGWRFA
jgi:hypothetical protein